MKYFSIFTLLLITATSNAQVKTYDKAIINTTINVVAPDEEEVQNIQQEQRGGGQGFRNMLDGETKVETLISSEKVKTTLRSDMGRSTIFRNNELKTTTTIMEMMGNINGFTATDEEQAEMQRKRDSIMTERRKKDTMAVKRQDVERKAPTPADIVYTTETKTIAGHSCKKAYLITTRILGIKDTSTIWVATDLKFKDLNFVGFPGNMPGMRNMGNLNGADKADGFIMAYTTRMPRGRTMDVIVTKINLDAKIDEKDFQLPKNVDIKPMSEMQNMFRGGGRFRDRD